MVGTKFSMKLLIDNNGKRVLFAEAGKDCVDFLFNILSLPVSTIIHFLGKQQMVGSVANLYESVETLDESSFQPNVTKDSLLKLPISPQLEASNEKKYAVRYQSPAGTYSYKSSNTFHQTVVETGYRYVSSDVDYGSIPYVASRGGFVKEATYMVMDDLVVKSMSTMSFITLLKQFDIENVSALDEKVVNLGMDEAMKLLKASLVSKNVLTSVFFNGKM